MSFDKIVSDFRHLELALYGVISSGFAISVIRYRLQLINIVP